MLSDYFQDDAMSEETADAKVQAHLKPTWLLEFNRGGEVIPTDQLLFPWRQVERSEEVGMPEVKGIAIGALERLLPNVLIPLVNDDLRLERSCRSHRTRGHQDLAAMNLLFGDALVKQVEWEPWDGPKS